MAKIVLTGGDDLYPAAQIDTSSDVIYGMRGEDTIRSDTGNDMLFGGNGDDFLIAAPSEDGRLVRLFGEVGNDDLIILNRIGATATGHFEASGGAGDDEFYVNYTDVDLYGGDGVDRLSFSASIDAAGLMFEVNRFSISTGAGMTFHADGIERYDVSGTNGDDRIILNTFDPATRAGDSVEGYGGDDVITTGTGKDSIRTGDGNALIHANAGDDSVYVASGSDTVYGGAGNDAIYDRYLDDTGGDLFYGGAGNDWIQASAYGDTVRAGSGNDVVSVQNFETLSGGASSNLNGGQGHDTIGLESSPDLTVTLTGKHALLTFADGTSLDTFGFESLSWSGAYGHLNFVGSAMDEHIDRVTSGTFVMGAGDDSVDLYMLDLDPEFLGWDVDGGDGQDTLIIDSIFGSNTAFQIRQTDKGGQMLMEGHVVGTFAGIETMYVTGSYSSDVIRLGAGDDYIIEPQADHGSSGSRSADTMDGGAGNDQIYAGAGDDRVIGGDGDDTLKGGPGHDTMSGGTGHDLFIYGEFYGSPGETDIITDFEAGGTDLIDLSAIDARTVNGFENTFTFIGTDAFSGEGQLRLKQVGGNTYVQLNTTGVDEAEITIRLIGVHAADLSATDFVL